MNESLFERVVVPVANPDDAASTTTALRRYIEDVDCTVVGLHVIEKATGVPDKASVEQRRQYARDIFAVVSDQLVDTGVPLETEIRYGTDIAATIIETAHDTDTSAIVFTPRGGSRWKKLLTGDIADKLVENTDIPVLVLPDREEDGT